MKKKPNETALSHSRSDLFEFRAAEMRGRMATSEQAAQQEAKRETYTLKEAAIELGVSYSTACRLCKLHVRRYSTGLTGDVVYPGMTLKRSQRVRFTYVIEEADIQKIKNLMRGIPAA